MLTSQGRIAALRAILEGILPPLADARGGYALLDFPDYSNVGDSLIWLGELAWFEQTVGRRPDYVCTTHGFQPDALRRAVPEGPIFLSGGGNFGDIYPRFQAFRHAVLEAFPGRRVVQLPQTLHFSSKANVAETRAAIKAHGNFAMMVRDRASFEFAQEAFDCEVHLAPDMAFCMGPLSRPTAPVRDAVALLRTDTERAPHANADLSQYPQIQATDWLLPNARPSLGQRIANRLDRMMRSAEVRFAETAARERQRGMQVLGSGRTVVTDRLHGHILSILMGIPQIAIDNSYGKISGFYEAWTNETEGVRLASSLTEALEMLPSLDR